jgi:hypothetical protein
MQGKCNLDLSFCLADNGFSQRQIIRMEKLVSIFYFVSIEKSGVAESSVRCTFIIFVYCNRGYSWSTTERANHDESNLI